MHGRTFTAGVVGLKATVWGDQTNQRGWGNCGTIVAAEGIGKKGQGWVAVKLENGNTVRALYSDVALGDNSQAKED